MVRTITVVATALFALGTLLLSAMAVPTIAAVAPGWVGPWGDSTAWWPMLVQVVLAGLAFWTWWWRHRRSQRSVGLVALAVASASVAVLGIGSYLGCTTPGLAPGWTTAMRVLGLLLGGYDTAVFGSEPGCAAGVPLALQMARLTVLVILIVGAMRAIVALLRNQTDRVVARLRRGKIVVTGLQNDSLPVLTKLVADAPAGTEVVVITADAGAPWLRSARSAGARVVIAEPHDAESVRPLVLLGRKPSLRALYLLSPDTSVNLAALRTVEAIVATAGIEEDAAPLRAVVRIDDPWQAEDWRRRKIAASGPWVYDAIGVEEVLARLLVDRLASRGRDRIVVCGRSRLVLALCAEFAQLARERHVLGAHDAAPELVLLDSAAVEQLAEHRLRQARFGNSEGELVTAVTAVPDLERLREVLAGSRRPAVVFAAPPMAFEDPLVPHLAALQPTWLLLSWRAGAHGVADEPVMAQLYAFGPTLDGGPDRALDSWERIARLAHERYRLANPANTGPSGLPWPRLSPFYQESNLRQVVSALRGAVLVGRTWGAVGTAGPASAADLSERELDRMAQHEHASWSRQYRRAGWRWGAQRDDARRRHPDLVRWDDLPPVSRRKALDGVLSSLALLRTLGYHSQPDPSRRWRAFEREGSTVTAERLTDPWAWRLHDGTQLLASAGDWRVTDGHGDARSVAPGEFARSYESLGDGRYRRTGRVLARRAEPGETVTTLEGDAIAGDGDWVVRGEGGEEWPVTAERFTVGYRAVADDEVQ